MDPRQTKFFISLVRDSPVLWMKIRKNQCSEEERKVTWRNLGSCMNPPMSGEEAAAHFQALEYVFNECNALAKSTERSGANAGAIFTPQWEYYSDLCFLRDQISPRRTLSNIWEDEKGNGNLDVEMKDKMKKPIFNAKTNNLFANNNGIKNEKMVTDRVVHNPFKNSRNSEATDEYDSDCRSSTILHEAEVYGNSMSTNTPKYSVDLTEGSSDSDSDSSRQFSKKSPVLHIENDGDLQQLNDVVEEPMHEEWELYETRLKTSVANTSLHSHHDLQGKGSKNNDSSSSQELFASLEPAEKRQKTDKGVYSSFTNVLTTMTDNTNQLLERLSCTNSQSSVVTNDNSPMIAPLIFALNQVPQRYYLQCIIQILQIAQDFSQKKA